MKNISIKVRLVILVIVGLLLLSGIITILAVNKSTTSLLETQFDNLSSVQTAKSGEIEDYFKTLEGLLFSLANHEGTKNAFLDLENGFYKLQDELKLDIPKISNEIKMDFTTNYLNEVNYDIPNSKSRKDIDKYLPTDINAIVAQYIFITNNKSKLGEKNKLIFNKQYESTYMNAHKKYHKTFDNFLSSFGLYDIFMVDLNGNLIYTDFKEKDFATNLKNGVYSNSGIARVFNKALTKKTNEIAFDDFTPYEPSYNSAASFIATPIFIEGIKKGVLIFQMPVDRINEIMSFYGKYKEAGLGESGESYLVGQDYKMRNNSRFVKDINNPVVQKLGSTIGVWEVKTDSTKEVVNNRNQKGKWIIDDYRGVSVLSVYSTIDLYGETKWAIIAEKDKEEALKSAVALRNIIAAVAIVILLLSILVFIYFINKLVAKPLDKLNDGILNLLNTHDTSSRVDIKANDEIGIIATNFNQYLDSIEEGIKEDQKVIENVSRVVKEVSQGSLSRRVTARTSNTTVQQLVDELNSMMINLQKIINHSLDTLKSYQNHDYRVKTSISCMGEICELMQGIDDLGSSISDMLVENTKNGHVLDSSAQNLLGNIDSLNKESIDASTNLEETAAALEEINNSINENTNNIIKMSKSSAELTNSSNEGEKLAIKTTVAMDDINKQVNNIKDAISVVDQIAFQTNILSLNAAVEAATAGEAGKGFSVVAQEVRNLANRSAEAAREIKELVENATSKANDGKSIADEMIKGYKGLNKSISENKNLIEDIETSSKEQATAIKQVNDALNSLDQQTQRNVVVVNNTYEISIQTSNLAIQIVTNASEKEFLGKNDIIIPATGVRDLSNTEKKSLIVKQANDNSYTAIEDNKQWKEF